MKIRLTNNLGLKTLSVLIAFFVWLLVVNVSNPEVTRTQEVALEIMNDHVLLGVQKTYELSRRTVSVTYDIHTMDEYKIRSSDFRAYVDLSELYDVTGSVAVKVEVLNNSNILRNVAAKPSVVRVQTEDLQSKEFKLVANIKGHPADGFSSGEVKMSPDTITVEGPMSQVGLINSVGIEIDVSRADQDITGNAVPVFYDANGNILNLSDRVEMNVDEISYRVGISHLKEIPLSFEVSGTPAEGFGYTGYKSSRESIFVSGADSLLAGISEIVISDAELNVSGLSSNKTVSIDLRSHLPEGVYFAGYSDSVVEVTLLVDEMETKTITLLKADVLLTGVDVNLNYHIQPERIGVTIRGMEENLAGVRGDDLGAALDVSGMSIGKHEAQITFETNDKFSVTECETIQVEVSEGPGGPGFHSNLSSGQQPEKPDESMQSSDSSEASGEKNGKDSVAESESPGDIKSESPEESKEMETVN